MDYIRQRIAETLTAPIPPEHVLSVVSERSQHIPPQRKLCLCAGCLPETDALIRLPDTAPRAEQWVQLQTVNSHWSRQVRFCDDPQARAEAERVSRLQPQQAHGERHINKSTYLDLYAAYLQGQGRQAGSDVDSRDGTSESQHGNSPLRAG